MLRPPFGLLFVGPDCLARFCGLLHLRLRCGWDRDLCSSHLPRSTFHPAPTQPAVLLARSAIRPSRSARSNNSSRASRICVCRAKSLIFSAIARKTSSCPSEKKAQGAPGHRQPVPSRVPFAGQTAPKPGVSTYAASPFTAEKDSLAEEAVESEPVSEWGANSQNAGNSFDSGLRDAKLPAKKLEGSMIYKQNSLRHRTGN